MGILGDAWDWTKGAVSDIWDTGKGIVTDAGEVARDAFSGDNAKAGQFSEADWAMGGGDPNRMNGAAAETRARDLGSQEASVYNQLGSTAQSDANFYAKSTQYGAEGAYNSANTYAKDLARTGTALTNRNVAQVGSVAANGANVNTAPLGAAAVQGAGNLPTQLGGSAPTNWGATADSLSNYGYDPYDATSQQQWSAANNKLANFSAQQDAAATAAGNRLYGYQAGPQTGYTADTYGALRDYATQGPGPSAAEAQLRAGADANVAAQLAIAKSGRGAGANANALRQASFNSAAQGQQLNNDLATLRANEAATWRGQQLNALGAAGQIGATTEAQRQGVDQLNLAAAQSGAQYGQQGSIAGNQMMLQAAQAAAGQYGAQNQALMQAQAQQAQLGLQGKTSAMQGYESMANYGLGSDVATQQARQNWANLGLQADVASQQAKQNWAGLQLQSDQATQQAQQNWANMGLSATTAAANQNAAASQLYLGGMGQAAGIANTGYTTQGNFMAGGTAARAGYENAAMGVAENEANRRASLRSNQMAGETAASQANQNEDYRRDQNTTGFLSDALGMVGGFF